MFCENCGNKLPDGAKFCHICGAMIKPAPQVNANLVPPPPPPPPPAPGPTQPPLAYPAQQRYAPPSSPPVSFVAPYHPPTPPPNAAPLSVGQYIIMFLLLSVPLLNLVLLFVWGFGGSVNPNKRNLARASLILSAVVFVIALTGGGVIMGVLRAIMNGLN